jgi:hypothetical protein
MVQQPDRLVLVGDNASGGLEDAAGLIWAWVLRFNTFSSKDPLQSMQMNRQELKFRTETNGFR